MVIERKLSKTTEDDRVRYGRPRDIVPLTIRFQGSLGGLTLNDIRADFSVSRRTAERLRDAVEAVFGPLEIVDVADNKRHWRLRSDASHSLLYRDRSVHTILCAFESDDVDFDSWPASTLRQVRRLRIGRG